MANLLIVHGGAPTAVLNSSLYGVIEEARQSKKIDKVFAAIGGDEGLMKEKFLDLLQFPEESTIKLLNTPSSSIGTSRYIHKDEDWDEIVDIFKKHDIRYVLMQGGNGTMNTCGNISKACEKHNYEIYVVGLPKTIDNDLSIIDHAPGYASAARFIATEVSEIGCDVSSLPIHVSVIETMGRNSGWLTAASALARRKKGDPPDLIYLPERKFNMDYFLEDVAELIEKKHGVVVVACEGLKGPDGDFLVPPIFKLGRASYPSDVGKYLSEQVTKRLGYKARYEKAGIAERASITCASSVDRAEAVEIGRIGVRSVLAGKTGIMVGISRISTNPYKIEYTEIPIEKTMMTERPFPDEWINDRGNDVRDGFIEWCQPLLGGKISDYILFKEYI